MQLNVQDQSTDVEWMARNWPKIEALSGGTEAMREAGERLLPKWPNEEEEAYRARLNTATLFNVFSRTVQVMAGKPFSKPLAFSDDTPALIVQWCDDVDREGVNLHAFAAELFDEALRFGICGALVEYPTVGEDITLADERDLGIRPYLVRYHHDQIIGWQADIIGGTRKLTQLRLREDAEVADGEYGTKIVKRVRVLRPGSWELWESDDSAFAIIASGTTSLSDIPFVPFYGRRKRFMIGLPPLLDLANLNIKHWQSQSDQDTILHVARVPILALIGAQDDTALTVGASTAVKLPLNADLRFVEHSGAAIAAGKTSLDDLELQMIRVGAELLAGGTSSVSAKTATESAGDQEANKSELLRITEGFEDALDQCLQYMADYVRLPSGGNVSLSKDFGEAVFSDASDALIVTAATGGLISNATAIKQLVARGVLSADVDPETEADLIEQQGPALGSLGAENANLDEPNPDDGKPAEATPLSS